MRLRRVAFPLALPLIWMLCTAGFGQVAGPVCGPPPVADAHAQPNIFTDQQEEWLGDAMADDIEAEYRPVSDPALTAHLQRIVDKLAATLPDTKIRFRVMLVESSEPNGSSVAGGHIYITRKLAAAAMNDDELASVLGHEMGHIASHQFAFQTTRDLKRLLNITSVGDKADIYAKFQQLMDARWRDKHPQPNGDDDSGQDEADKIGVYVAAAAGYRPQAEADFWNRVFFVGGKTGGKVSDFFGLTKPSQRRLRGMLALAAAMPKGCGREESEPTQEFAAWHKAVVADQAVAVAASPAMKEVTLTPPLHMDLFRLRFSPDGKMILAQDDGSIFVLSKETMQVKFRIDAINALGAEFSPDSRRVVFSTPGLHTEEWSIAEQKLIAANEVLSKNECLQAQISPDGRTMMCVWMDQDTAQVNLDLLDVASGTVVLEKKPFFQPTLLAALTMLYEHGDDTQAEVVPVRFSEDGNILLMGPDEYKVAIDLRSRTMVKIGGALKNNVGSDYAFIGNDRVAGIDSFSRKDSGIYSFPDGKLLQKRSLPGRMESVSGPEGSDMVLTYGVPDYNIGLVNFTTGHFLGLKTRAMDAWHETLVAEANDGSVGMTKLDAPDKSQEKHIPLPLSPLANPQSVSISPDGRYLALSTRYHGGIFDLQSGKEIGRLLGFTGAQWGPNDTLFMDVPKRDKTARHITEITTTPPAAKDLSYTVDDKIHLRYGMLIEWKDAGKKASDLVVHNPADDSVMWTRNFADGRATYTANVGGNELIVNYTMKSATAKAHLKENPALAAEAAALKDKDLGRLIEIINSSNGKTEGEVVLELPLNFSGTDGLNRMGDQLFVSGRDNRTMTYSLKTGKQVRQIFGYVMAIDPESRRVCTVNREDEAVVYDEQGTELGHYHMGSPLRFAQFRERGTRLVVLTADQKIRVMDLTKPMEAAAK